MKTYEFKDYLKRTFYHPSRNNEFPNGMQLDISATALAIYFYLMYIEDRKTYQCYGSLFYSTIGGSFFLLSVFTGSVHS